MSYDDEEPRPTPEEELAQLIGEGNEAIGNRITGLEGEVTRLKGEVRKWQAIAIILSVGFFIIGAVLTIALR